jgi:uncharacterized RDD family membrane protein YckC
MSDQSSQLDTRIEIVTAENISFQYRVAGPFRRLFAYLIDLVIRTAACGVIALVLLIVFGTLGLWGFSIGLFLIAYFILDWFYGGLFEALWNGQTPGKRLLQLRVISANGQPVSGWQAVLRNVLRVADALPYPTFQLGLLAMILNRRFQRLGDLVCGTMVVVEEPQRLYGVTRITDALAIRLAGELPANFTASRSLGRALSAYVQRRLTLGWNRRDEIARHLGEPLRVKFNLPPGTSYDLLLCALYHRVFIADLSRDRAGGENPFGSPPPVASSWTPPPSSPASPFRPDEVSIKV